MCGLTAVAGSAGVRSASSATSMATTVSRGSGEKYFFGEQPIAVMAAKVIDHVRIANRIDDGRRAEL
jgi:hypothetical protein